MTTCEHCIHALWDYWNYETYYGTSGEHWFICGCDQGLEESEECEEYEEVEGE